MRLFYSEKHDSDGEAARCLLSGAWRFVYGGNMPKIAKTPSGKPYFPTRPDVYFSISHTRTHVLAAIGEYPVGADVETLRTVRPGIERRVGSEAELEKFDLFSLWTLKESYIKLFGSAPPMRGFSFSRQGGLIIAPRPDVAARLYDTIPGCAAAVCVLYGEPPEAAEFL